MTSRSMTLLAAALVAACGGSSKPSTIGNTPAGGQPVEQAEALGPGFTDGALWTCQISDYDPQPCKVSRGDGGWQLTKLLGSQRFAGSVAKAGEGLAFDGDFFCPWGACDAPMQVQFEPDGDGTAYKAVFDGDEIRLRYDEALEGAWGGAGYGGLTGREQ